MIDVKAITIRSRKNEYSEEEILALSQAYQELYTKSQGEELTLEETRIIVAYKRLQQEDNFRIVAEKVVKPKKEKKPKKLLVREKKRVNELVAGIEAGILDEATLDEVDADLWKRYSNYSELEKMV